MRRSRWSSIAIVTALAVGMSACDSSDEPAWVTKERARLEQERALLERERAELVKERKELEEQRSGVTVTLPRGPATDIDPAKRSLVVSMTADEIWLDGKAVTVDELDQMFRMTYSTDRDVQVVIQADRGVPHARVVDVMERAKAAGLRKLAIGTKGTP